MDIHSHRLDQARRKMAAAGVDLLLVTHLPNVFYLSGFTGDRGALIVLPGAAHLFTDGRFTIQAREESPSARLHISRAPLAELCGKFLVSQTSRRSRTAVGYDPAHVSVSDWRRLKASAGSKLRWKPATGLVEDLREVKDASELETIRQAARVGSEVMAEVMGLVRPGVTEIDLAAEIDYRMRGKGASGVSFESIVASGPRAALPHARPTAKRIQKNELVILDLGAILAHYCSDLTRTVYVGRASKKVRGWYRAVEQAQQAGLEALAAGVTAGSVDRATRRFLERQHLGKYFVHSTGHGLGIEIHETPALARGQTRTVPAGSVVTLEPGIYMQGVGGIRIEDDVAVHSRSTEVLTSAPKGLLEI